MNLKKLLTDALMEDVKEVEELIETTNESILRENKDIITENNPVSLALGAGLGAVNLVKKLRIIKK